MFTLYTGLRPVPLSKLLKRFH